MSSSGSRPTRQQFNARVRIAIEGKEDLIDRFAANLSDGGIFIRDDTPPAPGSQVLIEFLLPDGSPLCRAAGKVVHARPANVPGERTAGMGIEFVQFDKAAQALVDHYQKLVKTTEPDKDEIVQIEHLRTPAGPYVKHDGPVVGIDLGTTNTCLAIVENGVARVIASREGYETVPSVVFVTDEKDFVVGHRALERMILHPKRAVYGSKRFIGRPFASREVMTFGHFFNYELARSRSGTVAAKVGEMVIPLENVAAFILSHIRRMAEQQLGCEVKRAIITVPAYFGERQRQAVREAGRLSGLYVERLLSEPTAAAVAFGYGKGLSRTILVYDLGGGTFDASVLRIDGDKMHVLATDGDAFLGGSDFDDRLTEYLLTVAERDLQVSLRGDPVTVQRLRFAAELAKRQLSEAEAVTVSVPYVAVGEKGPVNLQTVVERELLERMTEDLINRTLAIVDTVLTAAGIKGAELDDIVLVGGQSRSPQVARAITARFGKKPSRGVHPDHAVALGAAIIAGGAGEKAAHVELTDVLPASIRVGERQGDSRVLLQRGQALPAQASFEMTRREADERLQAELYRGESETSADNEFLGYVCIPRDLVSSGDLRVSAVLRVSADGLLAVEWSRAENDSVHGLQVSLQPIEAGEEIIPLPPAN